MIRLKEITDPELREKVRTLIAEQRGMESSSSIPDWFELDDADYADLLQQLREEEEPDEDDPRA